MFEVTDVDRFLFEIWFSLKIIHHNYTLNFIYLVSFSFLHPLFTPSILMLNI